MTYRPLRFSMEFIFLEAPRLHSPALPHTNIRKSRHQTPTPLLSRPSEMTLRAFPPPIRGPWGQLPVVSSAQTYRGFSADRPVVVIAWQLARGRDVTGFLSYLESCTMKSVSGLQAAGWDACTWKSFAVLPWGELPFWKAHSSYSLIIFNVFMVRHREV